MDDVGGMRRFGPMGVWFLVLIPDLALTGGLAVRLLESLISMWGDTDPTTDAADPALACAVLALSLAGTWWALLGRGHHPQTLRGALAVSLIRLILLALFIGIVAASATMD